MGFLISFIGEVFSHFKEQNDMDEELNEFKEQLATQLLTQFKRVWTSLPLWLRPYEILVTSSVSG